MQRIISRSRPLFDLLLTKTAINTYSVILGNFISAVLAFVFTFLAARVMAKADFGYFSAMLSLTLLVSDLSDMGIGTSLSAFLPPLESKVGELFSFLKTSLIVQTIILISVLAILFISAESLAMMLFHRKDMIGYIHITILFIASTIGTNFFQYALSARQKFFQVAFLSSYSSLIRVLLLALLIFTSTVSLTSVLCLHVVTLSVTSITALFLLKPGFIMSAASKSNARRLISFSYLIGIARGLTAMASRLDVLMMMALLTPEVGPLEVADYAVASKVVSIYPLFSGSFSTVIAPKLSTITDQKHLKKFMMKVVFGTLGLIGTILVMIILADPFMTLLFTKSSVVPFQLLLAGMIFFVASIPVVSLAIYYLKKPQILSVNSVLQLFIVVVGNFILIPAYGKIGPAVSLILSYGITLFTTALYVWYELKVKHEK